MALPAPRNPSVERISHRAGTLWKLVWVISKLRPYEKFVQRLRGSEEEAGQGEEVTVVRLLVVGEKKAGEDEGFSVSTSPWLLFLQRSGW